MTEKAAKTTEKSNKSIKKTRKKTKVVGTQQYINQATGEIEEMQVVSIEEKDCNFHKIWLSHIITALDLIGNQKIRLANFLLEQMNAENVIIMTQRQMAEKSGISLFTVQETIKALIEVKFLIRINQGAYQVNPDKIFKGGTGTRMNVLLQYHKAEEKHLELVKDKDQLELFK